MNRRNLFFMKRSIRTKLGSIFFFAFFLMFGMMVCFYINVNATIRQIDGVYSSNTMLNDLMKTLDQVNNNLYQYLNTKSSESLSDYYLYEDEYKIQIESLNDRVLNNTVLLMEKNIRTMSATYLDKANAAIDAKRGRNISLYKHYYEESEHFYQYLKASIYGVNDMVFRQNSANYLILRNALNNMLGVGIVFMLFIVILAIIWSMMMTRSITEPLIQMAGVANQVAAGNMDVYFPYAEAEDEMKIVAKACNKMLDSIREYIDRIKENMIRESQMKENELMVRSDLKEAQLKYLQAQINPHFLFNTLNAGVQLSIMEGAEKTCLFLENVADFFRYNVRKMGKDTTIRNEIQLVDNYIYILNVRFSGEIHYQKQYDERILNVRMPSMVLQPIIENAVRHGFQEMEAEERIELCAYRDGDCIVISIKDNGVGIADSVAGRIMHGGNLHRDSEDTGIGLDNVINRLKSYYSRDDVFVIKKREDGSGTHVKLFLYPKIEDLAAESPETEENETAEKNICEEKEDV